MRPTIIFQKILPSVINVAIVLLLSTPFLLLFNKSIIIKLVIIAIFFLYNLIFLIFHHNRDLGMIIVGTDWKENYPVINQLIYIILYTLSFSTLLFWLYFPFDLFLANMILLQLPTIILTGTTFHGYLSGRMVTVVK